MDVNENNSVDENILQDKDLGTDKNEEVNEPKTNNESKTNEVENLKKELELKENELKKYIDTAQRLKAEFDNYKKRTSKEKSQLYVDITADIVSRVIPILDNLERALSSTYESKDFDTLAEGIELIIKQFKEILKKEGVEEIKAEGEKFDPNLHDAVMHVEDDSIGENTVMEVFQKGYKIDDKIVRHSVVKVAN